MPALIAGGAVLGGALLSGAGGVMGSQSANRAGRSARDYRGGRTNEGYQRAGNVLYGQGFDPRLYSVPGGAPPVAAPGSLLARQAGLAGRYAAGARGIGSAFDQGVAGLENLYGQSEGLASQYGAGGEALIDEETARALKGANQRSRAQLAASGFGNSTAAANQESNNARNAARVAAEQKLGLRGEALKMRLGVRGQRAADQQANIGRRADLYNTLLNNEMGYRQQPLNTELGFTMSNVANPWLDVNTTQFYPGYSPAGTALTTGGNALGTYGGYMMMRDLYGGQGGGAGTGRTYGGMPGDGGGAPPWMNLNRAYA